MILFWFIVLDGRTDPEAVECEDTEKLQGQKLVIVEALTRSKAAKSLQSLRRGLRMKELGAFKLLVVVGFDSRS